MADNSREALKAATVVAPIPDKSNWEYVEVPEEDLFGEQHTGVSINFNHYGPGKHFVDPEIAGEIRRLLNNRLRSDMRVLQPAQDKKMQEIMERGGKPAAQPIR